MQLYQRPNSPYYWVTWYDEKGKRQRKSTGTKHKPTAQALVGKWEHERFMAEQHGKIPDSLFRDALLRYAKERKRKNSRGYEDSTRYRLQAFLNRFGELYLSEITTRLIHEYADERFDLVSEATVQKELSILKAILNKAKEEEYLEKMPNFPKLETIVGRCRWLTREEEATLLSVAAEHLVPIIIVALDSGGRRSELLRLDWQDVDFENEIVTFRETKNGEDRPVRMTDRVFSTLLALGPRPRGAVFTYRGKPIKRFKASFENARSKAELADFRFHDLRHTFASRLVQQGEDLYRVMKLMGHKSYRMVQRYSHLEPGYQVDAIGKLNSYGHTLGTAEKEAQKEKAKSLKNMVGAAGIEPATPAV